MPFLLNLGKCKGKESASQDSYRDCELLVSEGRRTETELLFYHDFDNIAIP